MIGCISHRRCVGNPHEHSGQQRRFHFRISEQPLAPVPALGTIVDAKADANRADISRIRRISNLYKTRDSTKIKGFANGGDPSRYPPCPTTNQKVAGSSPADRTSKISEVSVSISELEVTLVDTSFDTNPEQQPETLGNELDVDLAYVSGFCNSRQQLELCRQRLLILRFQVRVLGGSLEKVPPTTEKQ